MSGNEGAMGLETTDTDHGHHIVEIEDEQHNGNDIVVNGGQQHSTIQVDPVADNDLEEGVRITHHIDDIDPVAGNDVEEGGPITDIETLDRKISLSEDAYCKILGTIYKLLSFYAIMQAAILNAAFSVQQSDCEDSWGLLALSAILSAGVIIAVLQRYSEQFELLRRGRLLIQDRNSVGRGGTSRSIIRSNTSRTRVSDAEESDLDNLNINSNYWRWTAERAAFSVTLVVFSIYIWRSCESRLSCEEADTSPPST